MASRRLTISSLLCDDDPVDSPLAGPSSASSLLPPRDLAAEPYVYRSIPPPPDRASLYPQELSSFPAVPLAFQQPSQLRLHTPSPALRPDLSPSIPPSISRRSFKEIAFGDYPDSSSSATRSIRGRPDYHIHDQHQHHHHHHHPSHRRPSPELDLVRHPHSRTAIESLIHRPHTFSPSRSPYSTPSEPSSAERTYPEPLYSKQHIRSAPHSPVASFSALHRPNSQSPLLASTSSTFYSQSYVARNSPQQSRSPIQALPPPVPVPFSTTPDPPTYPRRPPLPDTHYSPTLAKPTLSALLTHSPPPAVRASASSLPHILNSPVMSRAQGMGFSAGPNSAATPGMEALEALAELATQERKRVAAGVDEEPEVNIITTEASLSPTQSPRTLRVDLGVEDGQRDFGNTLARLSPAAPARSPSTRSSPAVERGASLRASPVAQRASAGKSVSPVRERGVYAAAAAAVASPVPQPSTPPRSKVYDILAHTGSMDDDRVGGQAASTDALPGARPQHREAIASMSSPVSPHKERRVGSPVPSTVADPFPPRLSLDGEPPAKRRRSSPPASPPSSAADSMHVEAAEPSAPRISPKVESPELPLPPPVSVPAAPSPSPRIQPVVSPAGPVASPSPPMEVKVDSPTASVDNVKEEGSPTTVLPPAKSAQSAPKQKKVKSKEIKKRPAKPHETESTSSSHPDRTARGHSPVEEDPHEWLLEHYASSSRDKPSSSGSTSRHAHKHNGDDTAVQQGVSRGKASQPTKHKSKETHNRSRAPTPLDMLEKELEDELLAGDDAPPKPSGRGHDMDVDSELDFVVNETYSRREDTTDMDVDAELLSLLDDQPHPHLKQTHAVPPSASHEQQPRRSTSPAKSAAPSGTHEDPGERESMPPPPASGAQGTKKKGDASASATSKKKETADKTAQKKTPAAAAKPKPKPKAKPKASKKDGSATPAPVASTSTSTLSVPNIGRSKKTSPLAAGSANGLTAKRAVSTGGGASRSRSASVMPGGDAEKNAGEEDDQEAAVDDKLYCICKTSYDEDRVMIACDRCDEWYHTSCVDMPDLEVDLVDQFICPVCIAKHPELPLKTTYKTRCFAGLHAPDPSSAAACHRPSRGAFSKYCSDECGVKYMKSKIQPWPGDKRSLWEAVKHTERREGVVYRIVEDSRTNGVATNGAGARGPTESRTEIVTPSKTQAQRELERLEAALAKIEGKREVLAKEQEVLQWREKVVELAAARAERVQECGWDQRLCFGDEEVLEFGADVPDTYEEDERRATPDGMQVDGVVGEWWCRGKKKCDRHAGWQKLRQHELDLERELQEAQLEKLTTQEREIRKEMEGVTELADRKPIAAGPLQPYNGDTASKGTLKSQTNGVTKKGKKRKAEN